MVDGLTPVWCEPVVLSFRFGDGRGEWVPKGRVQSYHLRRYDWSPRDDVSGFVWLVEFGRGI